MRRLLLLLACSSVVWGQNVPQCDPKITLERLDCFPTGKPSEKDCQARGCCWMPKSSNEPDVNSPSCFYPKDYSGYKIENQTVTDEGLTIFLRRNVASAVDVDIALLQVDVLRHSKSTVRIRIFDPINKRWEPPLPEIPPRTVSDHHDYDIQVTETRLEVNRNLPGKEKVTIASFDLATLIFTDRFIQITNRLASDVVYGIGEHKGPLRRSMNYSLLTYWNRDRPPVGQGKSLYGTHPLYLNIEKGGDTNGAWLLNSNGMDVILQPTPSVTYRPIGGILDFFVFVGPTPADVVRQYQDIVGYPKLIPYWSLGFHLCRWGYKSDDHIRKVLQRNLDAGIRVEVQWSDIDYMERHNDFTYDQVNYKGLPKLVDELHAQGRRYVPILDPGVSGNEPANTYPPYDRGLEYNVFMKDINGSLVRARVWNDISTVFPDFTHPNASAYWTEMFKLLHDQVNFDGAWIDMNEPANIINGHLNEGCPYDEDLLYAPGNDDVHEKGICTTDQHHWSSHYNVHNMFGFTEAIATYNALQSVRPNQRPFIISRSSFSGHGHYASHWTGDVFSNWLDLKESISGFLEFSFYGVPMVGADICGFNDEVTPELCARWHALGAFYPFARNHNTNDSHDQDPAVFGDEVVIPTKNAFYWRYKLLPYLYTLFADAHMKGTTVTRPVFFDHHDDIKTYDIDEQFFWGTALMVVPALHEGQKEIQAYFPAGVWYDLQNRTDTIRVNEGTQKTVEAYNDTINFFMKGGNVVFFQEPGLTTSETLSKPYGFYVFLDENQEAEGHVFLDDGDSIDSIDKQNYCIVNVKATQNKISFTTFLSTVGETIVDLVHVYGVPKAPTKVNVGNTQFSDFQYDSARQLLTLFNLDRRLIDFDITFE